LTNQPHSRHGLRVAWRRRFGAPSDKDPAAWIGQGTAWIAFDAGHDTYRCDWLVGKADDHLLERTDVASAAEAVAWARSRTGRARIRLADHRTYWAGTDPSPAGFAGTWDPEMSSSALQPSVAAGPGET
jgi:hypothetical protein